MNKNTKVLIWILAGSCILNLIFAFNAGQKRRAALSKADNLSARFTELDLRHKNAIQSYEALEKSLEDVKKSLQDERLMVETLKETIQTEQKKSAALEEALAKAKAVSLPAPAAGNVAAQPKSKKVDRATRNW